MPRTTFPTAGAIGPDVTRARRTRAERRAEFAFRRPAHEWRRERAVFHLPAHETPAHGMAVRPRAAWGFD